MKNPDTGEDIDPAAAAVIAKAKRLMLVITTATFAAVGVILVIIGYRVSTGGGSAPPQTPDIAVDLPKGARVIAATVTGEHIAVTIELNGISEIRLFDAKTGKPAGRIELRSAP